jgi:Chromo (CHRromatin Organisation MOdifier) domain
MFFHNLVHSKCPRTGAPLSALPFITISAIHLDKHPGPDPFERDIPPPPAIISDNPKENEWEIESLLAKRTYRRKTQYLVRWKGFGPDEDTWMDVTDLEHAQESIHEFEQTHVNHLHIHASL